MFCDSVTCGDGDIQENLIEQLGETFYIKSYEKYLTDFINCLYIKYCILKNEELGLVLIIDKKYTKVFWKTKGKF